MSESITSTFKSVLTPSFIIKTLLGFFVMNVILDLTGMSSWFYNPVQSIKAKFPGSGN